MQQVNDRFYAFLEWVFELAEPIGAPIAIAAWLTVFLAAAGLAVALWRHPLRGIWRGSLAVGGLSLAAHLLDYLVTLRMSPGLGFEANPLWRLVVQNWGLTTAKLYGLSGKVLLSVLSFELFAFYLIQRETLYPDRAATFPEFWRRFGSRRARGGPINRHRLANFFSFCFALIGPLFFYVALLNGLSDRPIYSRFPPLPVVLATYLGLLVAVYLGATYMAYRGRVTGASAAAQSLFPARPRTG